MPTVEISLSSDGRGNWYFKKSSSAATKVLAFMTTGTQVVSGETGPYTSRQSAEKAAKNEAQLMRGQGVEVRFRE